MNRNLNVLILNSLLIVLAASLLLIVRDVIYPSLQNADGIINTTQICVVCVFVTFWIIVIFKMMSIISIYYLEKEFPRHYKGKGGMPSLGFDAGRPDHFPDEDLLKQCAQREAEEFPLKTFEKGKWYLCTKTHTLFQNGVAYKSYEDGTISDGCRTYLHSDTYRMEYFRPAPPVIIKAGNFYYCHKSILQDGIKEGNTYYSAKDGYLNTDTNVILYGEKDCIDFLFPDLKKNISD